MQPMIETPRPLPLAARVSAGLFWTRLQLSRHFRRKSFVMWALGLVAAVAVLRFATPMPQRELSSLIVVLITPLIALFYGGGALREEIDDATLIYPFTRPAGRTPIYLARLAAATAVVCLLAAMAAAVGVSGERTVRVVLASTLGGMAFTGFFALTGLLIKWSTWFGLGWVLLWEQGVGLVPGFLGRFALSTHLRSVADLTLDASNPLSALWAPPPMGVSMLVLVVVTLVAAGLGALRVQRRPFNVGK